MKTIWRKLHLNTLFFTSLVLWHRATAARGAAAGGHLFAQEDRVALEEDQGGRQGAGQGRAAAAVRKMRERARARNSHIVS